MNTLTKKARLELAKARLTSGESNPAEAFLLADKLKVTSATVPFHGGGDSGDFYSPDFEGGEPRHVEDAGGNWIANPKFGDDHERLSQLLTDMSRDWVEGTGVDWYNNDGGGGKVEFDFKTGEVSAHVFFYEQVRHDAGSAEWNLLGDGEEGEE